MKAFVINLDSRRDRWDSVATQASQFPYAIHRVEAISTDSLRRDHGWLTAQVAACWASHQRALSMFLDFDDDYALILEDDFLVLDPETLSNVGEAMDSDSLDFLQVGFLVPSVEWRLRLHVRNAIDRAIKLDGRPPLQSIRALNSQVEKRPLLSDYKGTRVDVVLDSVFPGAHAYMVNRAFAEGVSDLFQNFLSTDLFYIALAEMRSFRMARHRRSLVGQRKSQTSIEQRFRRWDH